MTADELQRTVNGSVRELPGSFETSSDVLGGLRAIAGAFWRAEQIGLRHYGASGTTKN